MKLWRKKGTWVMFGLLIVILSGSMLLVNWVNKMEDREPASGDVTVEVKETETDQAADWKTGVQEQLKQLQASLENPDLTDEKKKDIEDQAKILQYRLDHQVPPLDSGSREVVLLDPAMMSSIVLLLTVIVAAGIVPAEFTQGTIKMLLTRPVKRWKILTSKFLTVNLFGIFLMIVGYLVVIVWAFVLFDPSIGKELTWDGQQVKEVSIWGRSLYMLLLSFGNVFITATFAFMIGSVFRSSSLAIGLSLFIYFTGSTIVLLLSRYEIVKYLLFTHMDLTQFETGRMLIPDITMPFSLAVLAVYILIFLVISYLTFTKRDVTA